MKVLVKVCVLCLIFSVALQTLSVQAQQKPKASDLRDQLAKVAKDQLGYRSSMIPFQFYAKDFPVKIPKKFDNTPSFGVVSPDRTSTFLLLEMKTHADAIEFLKLFPPDDAPMNISVNERFLFIAQTWSKDWQVLADVVWGLQHPELYQAIVKGDLAKLKQLQKNGLDLKAYRFSSDYYANTYDDEGFIDSDNTVYAYELNALHLAVIHGHLSMVQYLLNQGFDLKSEFKLFYAYREWIMATGTRALELSIARGHKDVFDHLIKQGMDINHQDSNGFTPAFEAVDSDEMEWVLKAEKAGADYKHVDKLKRNALFLTTDFEIFKYLTKKYELDLKQQNRFGESLLYYQEDLELVKYLVKAGLDINHKDIANETPLHWAFLPEIIDYLVSQGADLSVKDKSGRTPIDIAIEWGDPDAYEALAKHMKAKGMDVPSFPEDEEEM